MKRLLILDMWYGISGGASKSVLYSRLAEHFDLRFLSVQLPSINIFFNYIKSININIEIWK